MLFHEVLRSCIDPTHAIFSTRNDVVMRISDKLSRRHEYNLSRNVYNEISIKIELKFCLSVGNDVNTKLSCRGTAKCKSYLEIMCRVPQATVLFRKDKKQNS